MSVRILTSRLREELSEAQRRSAVSPGEGALTTPESGTMSGLFKGVRADQGEPQIDEKPVTRQTGLRPRTETPPGAIPGGIADRFRLKSQRVSEIARSIDAYTSQATVAPPEANQEEPEPEPASITIELQSH